MYKKLYIIVFFLFASVLTHAQSRQIGLSWNISVPTGSTSNFVDQTSIRGGQFEFFEMLNQNISVGGSIGWNAYEEYTARQTYPIENGDITTDLVKRTYTLPLLFNMRYYYPLNGFISPYVGGGIGAMYSERDVYFNIYSISDSEWGFALRPEVGIMMKAGYGLGAILAADYLWATNKNNSLDINHTSSFNFRVGLIYAY